MTLEYWVTTLTDLLKALGWQVTLLVLVLMHRQEVKALLAAITESVKKLKTIKAGPFESEFWGDVSKLPGPREKEMED